MAINTLIFGYRLIASDRVKVSFQKIDRNTIYIKYENYFTKSYAQIPIKKGKDFFENTNKFIRQLRKIFLPHNKSVENSYINYKKSSIQLMEDCIKDMSLEDILKLPYVFSQPNVHDIKINKNGIKVIRFNKNKMLVFEDLKSPIMYDISETEYNQLVEIITNK